MITTTRVPKLVSSASMYLFSPLLQEKFTTTTRYGDRIELYRESKVQGKHYIWLPRNCTPMAEVDKRSKGIPVQLISKNFKPRNPQQARLIEEASELLLNEVSHIMESPTGSGKTVMATQVIAKVGRKTLIVVPKEDILDQWYEALITFLKIKKSEIGIIKGGHYDVVNKKVVIALIQSIYPLGKYPQSIYSSFGLMVVDECHKIAADQFSNVCWQVPALLRWGLSATPTRKDGRDIVLKSHIGEILVVNTVFTLIPRVLQVYSTFKIPMVDRERDGKIIKVRVPHSAGRTMGINKALAADTERNRLIVRLIKSAYRKDRTILVLSELKEHLVTLWEHIVVSGIKEDNLAYYIGGLTKEEREAAKIKPILLATYGFTAMATDIPWLDTLIMATPRSDVNQICGRILREHDTKKEPLVIDIIDRASNVLVGYANKRREYYKMVGAQITKA